MARIFMAMNGKRINTLDELKENFNSAQMISFYRGGRLQKWLEEIGASEELENIQSFEDGYDDDTLLSMLMAVFELSDEQIAKIESEKEEKQHSNDQTPSEEIQPVAVAENSPPATEPKNILETKTDSSSDLKIKWYYCGISKTSSGNSVAVDTVEFDELPEKGVLLRIGKVSCDGLCFANGYFVGCFRAKSYLSIGLSSDGIHWNMAECEELRQGSEIVFQDTNISFIIDDPFDLSGYIQIGDGNWQKIRALEFKEPMNSSDVSKAGHGVVWSSDDNIFYKDNVFYNYSLPKMFDFDNHDIVLSRYSSGNGWINCALPNNLSLTNFFVAKTGDYYFIPSDNSDILMYSCNGEEWKSYDFSKLFDKKWSKIKSKIDIRGFAFGNNRILLYCPSGEHYLLGEIES